MFEEKNQNLDNKFSEDTTNRPLGLVKSGEGVISNGKKYFPVGVVAKEFGYVSKHLARLCRQGRIDGIRDGKKWYVCPSSVTRYQVAVKQSAVLSYPKIDSAENNVSDKIAPSIVSARVPLVNHPDQKRVSDSPLRRSVEFNRTPSVEIFSKETGSEQDLTSLSKDYTSDRADGVNTFKTALLTFLVGGLFVSSFIYLGLIKIDFNKDTLFKNYESAKANILSPILKPVHDNVTKPLFSFLDSLFSGDRDITRVTISGLKDKIDILERRMKNISSIRYFTTPGGIIKTITKETITIPAGNILTRLEERISDAEKTIDSLRLGIDDKISLLSSRISNVPTFFSLPSTNTSGLGPTTVNPDHLESNTLKVKQASTILGSETIS